ncbi:MAG: hypothetical protein JJLCMIEE_02739 [Acidimicrobiales bacterium]|nr:hypothetical protein [Acidimicrobiales bacterium]
MSLALVLSLVVLIGAAIIVARMVFGDEPQTATGDGRSRRDSAISQDLAAGDLEAVRWPREPTWLERQRWKRSPEGRLMARQQVQTGKDAQVRWWQRTRSGLSLLLLSVALGAALAAAVGVLAVVMVLLLERAVG